MIELEVHPNAVQDLDNIDGSSGNVSFKVIIDTASTIRAHTGANFQVFWLKCSDREGLVLKVLVHKIHLGLFPVAMLILISHFDRR